jgi:hypothetical protein
MVVARAIPGEAEKAKRKGGLSLATFRKKSARAAIQSIIQTVQGQ